MPCLGARANVPLRTSVEGPGLPPPTEDILPGTYPPNAGYMDDFLSAVAIRNRIGEAAAKAAFFMGHVEYLGLATDSSLIALGRAGGRGARRREQPGPAGYRRSPACPAST